MRRLYGVKFDLDRPGRASAAVARQVADQMWAWAFDGHPPQKGWRKGIDRFGLREVVAEQVRREEADLHRLVLTEPHPADSSGSWRWVADLVTSDERMEFGIALDVLDQVPATSDPAIRSPSIVATVVDAGAHVGGLALGSRPMEVRGRDEAEALATSLQSSDRTLPVLVFTALPGMTPHYAIDRETIDQFAADSAAVARVVLIPDKSDTFVLADTLGTDLRVFNGAMRIYWPRVETGVHPLFLPDRINRYSLQSTLDRFVKASAAQYRLSGKAAELVAEHQRTMEQARVTSRLEATSDQRERLAQYGREVDALLEEVRRQAAQLAEGEGELVERDRRIAQLEADVTRLRLEGTRSMRRYDAAVAAAAARKELAADVAGGLEAVLSRLRLEQEEPAPSPSAEDGLPVDVEELEPEPADIAEAVLRAMERFQGTLELTEDAIEAAERINSRAVAPSKLWAALEALDQVAGMWQRDEVPPLGREGALRELGFPVSRVSQTAYGKYAHQYEFTYNGVRVRVDQHIRIGEGERIYWYESGPERKFVINHIGAHLRDDSTG